MRRARCEDAASLAVQPRHRHARLGHWARAGRHVQVRVGVEGVQHPAVREAVEAKQAVRRDAVAQTQRRARRGDKAGLARRAVAAGEAGVECADGLCMQRRRLSADHALRPGAEHALQPDARYTLRGALDAHSRKLSLQRGNTGKESSGCGVCRRLHRWRILARESSSS